MSTFGGDSWAREAQYRKRRVDDLVVDGIDGSSYKKLSTGKFACLICPHNPILDTPLMLSMHIQGSRHRAAEARLKERELVKQNEINKRIALSDCSTDSAKSRIPTRVSVSSRRGSSSNSNHIFKSVERENSSSQLLVGSAIAMGGGSEMKTLSLTLMKKIQMSVLLDKLRGIMSKKLLLIKVWLH
ncbi:hypothetical protein F0562_020638 [Nyssa sinensis]|uniref:Sodium channel modifier 1 zinc-finger domain-containing protein n=1 Tax=Nyssa sinensis TaxID=561372 RepID=A0A5J5BX63_9ASTE|nr:hypothetical protein F0562_020638 [Nyssa sinensis]